MKNLFKNLMLVAVAAMGFTACEQVIDDVNATNEKFTVNIVGEFADDTRSGFDGKNDAGTGYKSAWDGEETVRFAIIPDTFADGDKATYVDVENESKGDRATFAPTFDSNVGTIHAFSPEGVYDKNNASACKGGFTSNAITLKYENAYVVVPAEQTPLANSVDPAAHILAGKAAFAENVNMTFNHVVAYGKMQIKNFDGTIDKVEITASEPLAGTSCYYYYNEGKLNNANVKTITLKPTNVVDNIFWFGCAPADLSEGTLTVKIYSGDDTYTKELNITGKTDENGEKIKFQFQQGHVASFGVDMQSVEADVKEEVVDPTTLTYTLVTDVANLAVGDKVIIVAADFDVAMSTNQKTNNRGQADVTKDGDIVTFISDVQILTLEAGTKTGTFAFNTGSGYLYAASSSDNYLRTETTLSANSSWSITIANGTATIKAQGTNTRNVMQYNQSSSLFACYSSASQKALTIYKQAKVVGGDIELVDPSFELDVTELNFKADGESKVVNVRPLNYFEAEVTATTDAEWLSIENDGYTYTVTAAENVGEAREAVITFTSGDISYDVTVAQAGETASITVAEFITRADEITEYILTGEITNVVNTDYGNFDLKDETGSIYVYGIYDNGNKAWTAKGLKEGDTITLKGKYLYYGTKHEVVEAQYISHVSAPFISADNVSVTADATTATINVKSNVAWSVSCLESWITSYTKSGENDGTIAVTMSANDSTEDRVATFTLTADGVDTVEVKLTQAAYVEPGEEQPKTYTLQFGATYNSKGQSSYSNSWYVTCDEFIWDIVNANNNNNGWNYIKIGSKKAAYVGEITTRNVMPETIKTVTMSVSAITAADINSIKLYVATDSAFSEDVQTISVTPAQDDLIFNIPTPTANCFYKIEVDCKKASSNGPISITKVVYTNE